MFDISAQRDVTLSLMGYIKPLPARKGKNTYSVSRRLSATYDAVEKLLDMVQPTTVAVEDYARRFSQGRSSAQTIILLSVWNETCSLVAFRKIGKDTFKYPVVSIRAEIGRHFGVKIVSKDDIFPEIVKNCKRFAPEKNRSGNVKTESGDVADSIAVGITHIVRECQPIHTWDI